MTELDKIALEVAGECFADRKANKLPTRTFMAIDEELIDFARRLVAKLSEGKEPVARLLHWHGPAHYPVHHGGIAARTYTEFSKEDADKPDSYWKNGASLYLHPPITTDTRTLDVLRQCRSSVRFDLLHYEKMARAYGNLGPEGQQKHEVAEAEANRLHKLIDEIDAITELENKA